MRLLRLSDRGQLSLTNNLVDDFPPYAILSHTWGADTDEEVTFNDLESGLGKSKVGHAKIQFCGQQARTDGIEYFWVDTCCINKANHTELSEAITSTFLWYRNAVKCYVYLSDVSTRKRKSDQLQRTWESAFRISRWFTRGWTLQELLAPVSVEFFSREGDLLGDKKTLEQQITDITGIPIAALRGAPLSDFSIEERLRWASNRSTRRKEDQAYCLLGIFDVFMPLIYGEGDNAFYRLKEEINKGLRNRLDEPRNEQSLSADEPLSYHPLEDFNFRLLILEPGRMGSIITGRLQELNLVNPPAYYALSYVWGQEPLIHRAIINNGEKFIQPNLFHALQRIRPPDGKYPIWVDSLCINQLDSSERNMQVRQMATIYRNASGVLIWLGEEDSTSNLALDFVSKITSGDFRWGDSWWEQYGFTALAQILERAWFRRGWVLQEAAFSKNSTIHCGGRQVYMDHFIMAINTVRDRLSTVPSSFGQTLANFHDSPAIRLVNTIKGVLRSSMTGDTLRRRMSLESLVDLSTSSETTDQRDTIYALLNLANDIASFSGPDQSDAIIPDYRKPVLDVYVDFILHCCLRSGTLDIICRPWAPVPSSSVCAVSKSNRVDHNFQTYPSWIASKDNLPFGNPSWRLKHRLHGNPLVGGSQKRSYYTHYGSKPHVSVGRNKDGTCDGSLHVSGLVLGEIAEISTRMADAILTKECIGILGMVSRDSHSNLIDIPDTVWRSLCADRDEKGGRAPQFYQAAMAHLLEISSVPSKPGNSTNLLDDMSSIDPEEILDIELPEHVEEFLKVIRDVIWNRRTFRSKVNDDTDRLLVGLIPQHAKIGDQICILYGCSVPVVLRKLPRFIDEFGWQLIGDAYVHGIMDGEAVSSSPSKMLQTREAEFKIL
jgi:hypothetical protein